MRAMEKMRVIKNVRNGEDKRRNCERWKNENGGTLGLTQKIQVMEPV